MLFTILVENNLENLKNVIDLIDKKGPIVGISIDPGTSMLGVLFDLEISAKSFNTLQTLLSSCYNAEVTRDWEGIIITSVQKEPKIEGIIIASVQKEPKIAPGGETSD